MREINDEDRDYDEEYKEIPFGCAIIVIMAFVFLIYIIV